MTERGGVTRSYYGWKITGALAITETVSWGILYYAFSVFLLPMQAELGWSLAVLTGAFSLALLLSGAFAPIVGRWIDRRGPRLLMTSGSILGALSVLAWSQVDSVALYYLAWSGIGIAMSATLYEPAFATLTAWFRRDRSRAYLAVTIAAGFASTIFLPLSGLLAERFGWRSALVLLAVLLAITTIPLHALVLRRRPEDLGFRIDGVAARDDEPFAGHTLENPGMPLSRALRDPSFWWLTAAFVLQTFVTVAVSIILIPYLASRGEDPAFAATATGLIGAAQVLARIVSTAFGGRVPAVTLTAAVFALQASALGMLMEWHGNTGLLVSVLLLGAGRGVVTLMRAELVGELYGTTHYGAINGTLALFLTVAGALAPICAGLLHGITGTYTPILWSMAALSLCATAAMLWLGHLRQRATSSVLSGSRRR